MVAGHAGSRSVFGDLGGSGEVVVPGATSPAASRHPLQRGIFSRAALVLFLLFFFHGSSEAAGRKGKAEEFRTISTNIYDLVVQKDARVDIQWLTGESIIDNACPMAQLEGDEKPKSLPVEAIQSNRIPVDDPMGMGQGMVVMGKDCEWRLCVYPGQPFFTAQVVYTNTSKHPVRIAQLIPWAVSEGAGSGVSFGPNPDEARFLGNGQPLPSRNSVAEMTRGGGFSAGVLSGFNPTSNQGLLAGFLTANRALTQVRINRTEKAGPVLFDVFRAECVYDPAVELQPGEALSSERVYIALLHAEPHKELENYGRAVALSNGIKGGPAMPSHGLETWNPVYQKGIGSAFLQQNLAFMNQEVRRYGWNFFGIGVGWDVGDGSWEASANSFPDGMAAQAKAIHALQMKAGLYIDPFTVPRSAPLAQAHPDWMVEPNAAGKAALGPDRLILDVTTPGAYEYVRSLASKVTQDWGYDTLQEGDSVHALLLAESYHNPKATRAEAVRLGFQALREGLQNGAQIHSNAPPLIAGLFSDQIRTGMDNAPLWRSGKPEGPWGCVESLGNAIRRYYLSPALFLPDPGCAFFGHDAARATWKVEDQPKLTWSQSVAWFTGAALTGGAVKTGESFSEFNPAELEVLRKLLPSLRRPAKPIDLFQDGPPNVWSLPVEGKAGRWQILAVFNWDEKEAHTFTVPFEALGLDPGAYYTVYEFWGETYYGTAQSRLDVQTPPGSVLLFGLRKFEEHPMFLASNRHFTQGALDHELVEWKEDDRMLHGRFAGLAGTNYRLRVLAQDPYTLREAVVTADIAKTTTQGRVICMEFRCGENGPVDWQVQF